MTLSTTFYKLEDTPGYKGLVLVEVVGNRHLGMRIDEAAFSHFIDVLGNKKLPYPLIHETFAKCLLALGAKAEKLLIYGLVDGYFRAKLFITHKDTTHELEINVIDGIILSVGSGCPIFVDEQVLIEHNRPDTPEEEAKKLLQRSYPKIIKH